MDVDVVDTSDIDARGVLDVSEADILCSILHRVHSIMTRPIFTFEGHPRASTALTSRPIAQKANKGVSFDRVLAFH